MNDKIKCQICYFIPLENSNEKRVAVIDAPQRWYAQLIADGKAEIPHKFVVLSNPLPQHIAEELEGNISASLNECPPKDFLNRARAIANKKEKFYKKKYGDK